MTEFKHGKCLPKQPDDINTFDGPVPLEWNSTPNAANTTTSLCSNNKTVLCE